MSNLSDAAIVAALILDIISMYKERGVVVDLASLTEAIQNEEARREAVKKELEL